MLALPEQVPGLSEPLSPGSRGRVVLGSQWRNPPACFWATEYDRALLESSSLHALLILWRFTSRKSVWFTRNGGGGGGGGRVRE